MTIGTLSPHRHRQAPPSTSRSSTPRRRSLKKAVLGRAGGRIGTDSKVPIIEALRDITRVAAPRRPRGARRAQRRGQVHAAAAACRASTSRPAAGRGCWARSRRCSTSAVGMDPEISGLDNILIRGLFLGHDAQADGGARRRHRRLHRARRLPVDAAAHLLHRHAGAARARRRHQHRPGDPAARRGHRRGRRGVPREGAHAAATSWSSAPGSSCSPRTPTSSSPTSATPRSGWSTGTIREHGPLREVLHHYKGRDVLAELGR